MTENRMKQVINTEMIIKETKIRSKGLVWSGYSACAWALLTAGLHLYVNIKNFPGSFNDMKIGDFAAIGVPSLLLIFAAIAANTLISSWRNNIPKWMPLIYTWIVSVVLGSFAIPPFIKHLDIHMKSPFAILGGSWLFIGTFLLGILAFSYSKWLRKR